jgi:hypothetical protein
MRGLLFCPNGAADRLSRLDGFFEFEEAGVRHPID